MQRDWEIVINEEQARTWKDRVIAYLWVFSISEFACKL
jgi:hypothetical protein